MLKVAQKRQMAMSYATSCPTARTIRVPSADMYFTINAVLNQRRVLAVQIAGKYEEADIYRVTLQDTLNAKVGTR